MVHGMIHKRPLLENVGESLEMSIEIIEEVTYEFQWKI